MNRTSIILLTFFIFIITVISSCQNDIKIVNYSTQDRGSFIGIERYFQDDTLLSLPYPMNILQQKNSLDSISLILETPKSFEYLLINKPNGKWQVDTDKSGQIFSPSISGLSAEESKHGFSFADPNLIQYVTDDRTLKIP